MHSENNFTDQQLIDLKNCERTLQYTFRDRNLLFEAITHASSSNTRLNSYERLEFLGDSILGFVVCEYLFQTHPDWLEGQLTKIKSVVVSRQTCGRLGNELGLEEFLLPIYSQTLAVSNLYPSVQHRFNETCFAVKIAGRQPRHLSVLLYEPQIKSPSASPFRVAR